MDGGHIALGGLGAHREGAVDEHLDRRWLAPRQMFAEARGNHQGQADAVVGEQAVELAHVLHLALEVEIAGRDEAVGVVPARRAAVLVHHGEGQVLHVQGEAEAEQHHEQGRHEEGQGEEQPVADDLAPFLPGQGDDAAAVHGALRAASSSAVMRCTKTSSMDKGRRPAACTCTPAAASTPGRRARSPSTSRDSRCTARPCRAALP